MSDPIGPNLDWDLLDQKLGDLDGAKQLHLDAINGLIQFSKSLDNYVAQVGAEGTEAELATATTLWQQFQRIYPSVCFVMGARYAKSLTQPKSKPEGTPE